MKKFIKSAEEIQKKVVEYRKYLHSHPETDMDLPKTMAYVKEKLENIGYEPKIVANSGLIATVGGKKTGKVVLLRADMDALPIVEETDLSFKSKNKNMHACGHDMHTAMLLGAAELLKEVENEINGTVKLMFQPAEETLKGAKAMVEAGILEDPKVDAAMMIHVFTGLPLPSGLFIIPESGPSSAASDWFDIKIQGKGGHGAMPDTTIDPLNVLSHLHISLQALNSREVAPAESIVVTVGKMGGGNTSNVIPDTASMEGTVRTFNPEVRKFIEKRIKEISQGVSKTFNASATVNYKNGCPSVINDKQLVNNAKEILKNTIGKEKVLSFEDIMPGGKLMGSEDFSFVSQKVPSIMMALSTGNSKEGFKYPQHHPKAIFDEKPLYLGVAAYAGFAFNWLNMN